MLDCISAIMAFLSACQVPCKQLELLRIAGTVVLILTLELVLVGSGGDAGVAPQAVRRMRVAVMLIARKEGEIMLTEVSELEGDVEFVFLGTQKVHCCLEIIFALGSHPNHFGHDAGLYFWLFVSE